MIQKLFLILGLVLVFGKPNVSLAQYSPKVGERHPDFCLRTIDGKETISLSSYRGKKVLLIHFASW